MYKNVAGQKVTLLAIDTATGAPKTGDGGNITAYVNKDNAGVTVLADTSATEDDATNSPGTYTFDLAQAETNADKLVFSGKSSTSGVRIVPKEIYTRPPNFGALAITAGGVAKADLETIKTQTVTCGGGVTVPGATLASTTNITAGSIGLTAAGVQAVWDALTSAMLTSGSIGKWILDKLDVVLSSRGSSANQTTIINAVNAITTNTARSAPRVPAWIIRPASGTTSVVADLYLYNLQGALEDADANTVTVHCRAADGTSYDSRLASTTMTRISAGKYRLTYTATNTDTAEEIYFDFTWAVGSVSMADGAAATEADAEVIATLATINTNVSAIKLKTDNLPAAPAAQGDVTTAQSSILSKLLKYFQLALRKDAAIASDNATELTALNANGGSGAGGYVSTTDALEALRDRGDAAWVTGTALDAAGVRAAVGLATANLDTQLDALPTAAEIVTAVFAGTGDGISLAKHIEISAAFYCGKVSDVSSGGISTYTYMRRDGSTPSFTSACSETDGTRATTGTIP
jgi:hypothetical protein